MLSNGKNVKMGEFVDKLIEKNNKKVYEGKDCEILPIQNIELLSTDFRTHFPLKATRVSRHLAPKEFVRIKLTNGSSNLEVSIESPGFCNGPILPQNDGPDLLEIVRSMITRDGRIYIERLLSGFHHHFKRLSICAFGEHVKFFPKSPESQETDAEFTVNICLFLAVKPLDEDPVSKWPYLHRLTSLDYSTAVVIFSFIFLARYDSTNPHLHFKKLTS